MNKVKTRQNSFAVFLIGIVVVLFFSVFAFDGMISSAAEDITPAPLQTLE